MSQAALFEAQPWGDGPMPLSWFPEDARLEIERLVALPDPPPKWIGNIAQITSRAWYEWHRQRGHDPDSPREAIPARLRAAVLARDGLVCQLCLGEVEPGDVHLDHRHPVSRGGRTSLSNLQVTHSVCNMRKGARILEDSR